LNSFQKKDKWPQTHKEMFNIFSHKGNANQATLRFHLTLLRLTIIKETNHKCWWGCWGRREGKESLYNVGGNLA
jgi:hypothetical protein